MLVCGSECSAVLWPSARLVHFGTWPLAGGEALAYDLQAR